VYAIAMGGTICCTGAECLQDCSGLVSGQQLTDLGRAKPITPLTAVQLSLRLAIQALTAAVQAAGGMAGDNCIRKTADAAEY
jgi:hypothetical protein